MKIIFFEVQEWEKPLLSQQFPEATLISDKLSDQNVKDYTFADIISTFIYSSVTAQVIDALPQLKYIATRSTGFDHIDVGHAKTKGIHVSNVPEYGSHTVAEHTFALLLTLTRRIHPSIHQAEKINFDHNEIKGVDLYGKTLGIIGLGKIGDAVARIAKGFGMNVVVSTRTQNMQLAQEIGFTYADLNTLLQRSDIISLHVPYTKETHHIINKNNISSIKKGAYLINTARGGLIETEALIKGLDDEILAGVAVDVLEGEKELSEEVAILVSESTHAVDFKMLLMNHVLLNHPKVIITPHNAFNSQEALMKIENTTIENIKAFEGGKVVNNVVQ
jgi:D-lactate dehydrogenase